MDQGFIRPTAAVSSIEPSAAATATDASRYFAASAYRDSRFRHQVLDFMRHGWYRARAPEFGIDETFVCHHCRRAQLREHIRNAIMLVVVVIPCHRVIADLIAYPDEWPAVVNYYADNIVLGLVLSTIVLFVERLVTEHYTMTRVFGRATPAAAKSQTAESVQNLVVYGGYSPFVGSGYDVGGWSFSVNLERTRDELGVVAEAIPFDSKRLLDFVKSRLDRLHLTGLKHQDMLFVDGRLLREAGEALINNGQPRYWVPQATIDNFSDCPAAGTRSYICVTVADWSGELVLAMYLRCKKGESNLFLEASYFMVAPPKRSFFAIDEIDPQLRLGMIFRMLRKSVLLSSFIVALTAFRLMSINWLASPIVHWLQRRSIRRAIRRNPRFNFGATTSVREIGMENYYRVFFQRLDKERHIKTVEQCTIDAIVEFLAGHNIDTSDIKDRKSAILNNGVIVAGGDLNAQNMAVGTGAVASLARFGAKIGLTGGSSGTAQPAATRASL